jgi:hypothetical protein
VWECGGTTTDRPPKKGFCEASVLKALVTMAVLLKFELNVIPAEVYDRHMLRLVQVGVGTPPGRRYHVAYGSPDRLRIADVWDTPSQFQKFCTKLASTLEEFDVVLVEPDVYEVSNIIRGSMAAPNAPARLLAKFDPPEMTVGLYNQIVQSLNEAELGSPPGRCYHVCYRQGEEVRMMSTWESDQQLWAFFDQVVAIITDLGIHQASRANLAVEQIHRIIDGSARTLPGAPRLLVRG